MPDRLFGSAWLLINKSMRYWIDLVEAKFRQPHIMYHGTSDVFLRGILSQGLIANPPKKRWDDDTQQSSSSFNRTSLPGSYWTSNLMTARSSSTNTVKKFGGHDMTIIAQIAEQSAYADEDSISSQLMWAMNDTMQATHPNIRSSFWIALADDLFGTDQAKRKHLHDIFTGSLHKHLKGSPLHEPVLMDELLNTLVLRSMAFEKRDGMTMSHWINPEVMPDIPSIESIEQKLLGLREKLTRSYRSSALDRSDFQHTLRYPNTVGFKGATKILSIVRNSQYRWQPVPGEKDQMIVSPYVLLYGTGLPDDFIKQHKERVGDFPGLVDSSDKVILSAQGKHA